MNLRLFAAVAAVLALAGPVAAQQRVPSAVSPAGTTVNSEPTALIVAPAGGVQGKGRPVAEDKGLPIQGRDTVSGLPCPIGIASTCVMPGTGGGGGGGDASAANQLLPLAVPGSDAARATAVQGVTGGKPVPVSGTVTATGPLTDTQLRATPVPISGTVTATTGGLTDTQLRATAVPVSGPLTDTQIRATALPVSGTVATTPGAGAPTSANQVTGNTALGAPGDTKCASGSVSCAIAPGIKALIDIAADTSDVNIRLNNLAGTAIATGSGTVNAGTQRFVIATDQPAFTVNWGSLNGAATAANQALTIGAKVAGAGGGVAATNSQLIGCIYNASWTSANADGQQQAARCELTGQLQTSIFAGGASLIPQQPSPTGVAQPGGNGLFTSSAPALMDATGQTFIAGRTPNYAKDTAGLGVAAVGEAMWSTTDLTPAIISGNTTGADIQIVSGTASQTTRVHRMRITAAGSVVMSIKDGTTVLEVINLIAGVPFILNLSDRPYYKTTVATALNYALSAAIQVNGVVEYRKN